MKRVIIAIVSLCILLSCITVFAQDDIMKISMSGNTLTAKDIGTGKGVSFTLPELENDEFYIYASLFAFLSGKIKIPFSISSTNYRLD